MELPGAGHKVSLWRRAWRDKILPAVVRHAPDLILLSAGFDAHRKDGMNHRFLGVQERDYEWLTAQIVQVLRPFSPQPRVAHRPDRAGAPALIACPNPGMRAALGMAGCPHPT